MIYCDPWESGKGHWVAHLVADSLPELHAFAKKIGLKREWFQCKGNRPNPHYDLTTRRAINRAIAAGAQVVPSSTIAEKCAILRNEITPVHIGSHSEGRKAERKRDQ